MELIAKQRVMACVEHLGISVNKFEIQAGLSSGYVNKLKKDIKDEHVRKIVSAFPEFSENWIKNGYGEMLVSEVEIVDNKPQIKKSKEEENGFSVPLVLAEATAGGLPLVDNPGEMLGNLNTISCPVRADLAMAVTGQSMEPVYPDGSIVLLKSYNPDLFIEWGSVFVLDTINGAVLKEVHQASDESKVRCVSLNTDAKYAPYDVPKSAIRKWFKVVYMMCAK